MPLTWACIAAAPLPPPLLLPLPWRCRRARLAPARCRYWASAEAGYLDLATYYGLPVVSLKAGCFHMLRKGLPGFRIDDNRRWACRAGCGAGWGGGGAEEHQGVGQRGWAARAQQPHTALVRVLLGGRAAALLRAAAAAAGWCCRARRERGEDQLETELFFHDGVHPNGLTGHRALGELAWHLLDSTLRWAGPGRAALAGRQGAAALAAGPGLGGLH